MVTAARKNRGDRTQGHILPDNVTILSIAHTPALRIYPFLISHLYSLRDFDILCKNDDVSDFDSLYLTHKLTTTIQLASSVDMQKRTK